MAMAIKMLKSKRLRTPKKCIQEVYPYVPPVGPPTGWLLRMDLGICETMMLNSRKTIATVLQNLNQSFHDNHKYSGINLCCPTPEAKKAMINRCITLAAENQRLRTAFGSLARKWIFKHIKQSNEEDLLTGEAPKKLVRIYDWKKRCVYNFEAMTILRDMTSRLMNHSYLFPKFLIPRNPYTNMALDVLQFFSIMRQLHSYGLTNWKLEGLLESDYSMTVFREKFGEPIKREIIEKQFDNLKSEETIDIIMEFIEDQHDVHGRTFNRFIHRWTLENTNCSALRMKFWITACKKYNMLSATVRDPHQLILEVTQLELSTKKYCGVPIDLIRKRESTFKKALVGYTETDAELDELEGLIVSMSINHELEGLINSESISHVIHHA